MENDERNPVETKQTKPPLFCARTLAALVFAALAVFTASLGSETYTLRTWYPSPYGSYTRLLSTGNTILARDTGGVSIGTGTLTDFKLAVNGQMYSDSYDMKINTYDGLLKGAMPSRPGKLVYVDDTDEYYYATKTAQKNDPETWYKPVAPKATVVAVAEGPELQYILNAGSAWYQYAYVWPWHWNTKYKDKLDSYSLPWFKYSASGMEMLNVQLTGKYCMYNGHFDWDTHTVDLQYWGIYETYSGWVTYGLGTVELNQKETGPDGKPYICGDISASGSVKTYDGLYGTYFYVRFDYRDDGAYYIQAWQDEYVTLHNAGKTNYANGNKYCAKPGEYGAPGCQGGWAGYFYQSPRYTKNMKLTITKMF
ncbi:MAG: hypothetical protein WCS77_01665 [Elusimicrobiaceae bacterium]